jgi:hypothetical protein
VLIRELRNKRLENLIVNMNESGSPDNCIKSSKLVLVLLLEYTIRLMKCWCMLQGMWHAVSVCLSLLLQEFRDEITSSRCICAFYLTSQMVGIVKSAVLRADTEKETSFFFTGQGSSLSGRTGAFAPQKHQACGQCQAHPQHHSRHISHALHVYEVNHGQFLISLTL